MKTRHTRHRATAACCRSQVTALTGALILLGALALAGCDSDSGGPGTLGTDATDTVSTTTAADTAATSPADTGSPTTQTDTVSTTAEDTSAPTDTGPTTHPVTAPGCVDGLYTEALPATNADISGVKSGYDGNKHAFYAALLGARYPIGKVLVESAVAEAGFGDCVAIFAGSVSDVDGLLRRASTVVHECGHFLDIERSGLSDTTYVIRPDLSLVCRDGDARERHGKTFARSTITQDEYDARLPGDFYKDTYLVGDGSEQGFDMLMEEAVQYVNSLATDYALADQLSEFTSITARDGILTFLWYMQRYLRWARLHDTEVHNLLLGDACWRELILTVWGRAWLFLDVSAGDGRLGIDDATLEDLVLEQELLGEISRVRTAHGCQ